ncbi:MAG: response regulator [Myxococcota bacterium]
MKTPVPSLLIVEDEMALRESLRDGLSRRLPGLLVSAVGSAEEALIQIKVSPPTLVVSDIRLPGLSGLDLLMELHHHRSPTKVILMSAFGSMMNENELAKRGAVVFVQKPFALEHMSELVREHTQLPPAANRLDGISLIDILQILNANRSNARVVFSSPSGMGSLSIRRGDVVDAISDRARGIDVALAAIAENRSRFDVLEDDSALDATIDYPLHSLLMEATRRLDEGTLVPQEVLRGTDNRQYEPLLAQLRGADALVFAAVVGVDGRTIAELGNKKLVDSNLDAKMYVSKVRLLRAVNLLGEFESLAVTLQEYFQVFTPLPTESGEFVVAQFDRRRSQLALAQFSVEKAINDYFKNTRA